MRYSVFVTVVVFFLAVSCQSVASPERVPNLASVQAAAAEVGKEDLLFGKHADRPVPVASITKLMTALVVVESGQDMDEWLTFEERHVEAAANAWSRIRVGSQLRRRDVLRIA